MSSPLRLVLILAFLLCAAPAPLCAQSRGVGLTPEELAWLKEHPVLRLAGDPSWLPMEAINAQGEHVGVIPDMLAIVARRLKIEIRALHTKSWTEALDATRSGRADLLSGAETADRREWLSFTRPLLKLPIGITVRRGVGPIRFPKELKGKRLVVPKGYAYVATVRAQYSGAVIEELGTVKACVLAVSSGEAEAMIATLGITSHVVGELGLNNLEFAYYTQPTSLTHLTPIRAGPTAGGSAVTVHGTGLAAFAGWGAPPAAARCRWDGTQVTIPTALTAGYVVCATAP